MTVLISKMCPFDSQWQFWFPKCVRLILKWHFWFTRQGDSWIPAWHPTLGGQRALIFCCQSGITWPQGTEKVFRGKLYHSYASIWCLSEVHIDSREKGTWHEPTTRIWFPLACVADSLNGRDFVTRLAAKQATSTEARRQPCTNRLSTNSLLREAFYFANSIITACYYALPWNLLMDYNLAYA